MRNDHSRYSAALNSPWVIFTVGLAMRLVVAGQLVPGHMQNGFYEANEPARIGWAIASGYGYSSPWPHTLLAPTAQQPPAYPYLIALIFKFAGRYSYPSLLIAVGINVVFSAFTGVLILQLGRRTLGEGVGVVAAWIWACWLYAAVVSIRLWSSSVSAFLLSCSLICLFSLAHTLRSVYGAGFGILAAIAAMTDTSLLPLFGFFWLWLWLRHRRQGEPCAKPLFVSIGVFLLALLPWTIRNYEVFHRIIPIRDNLGLELWIGNHDGVTYLYDFAPDFPLLNPTEFNRLGEIQFMDVKREIALRFIWQHPISFLHFSAQRFVSYWTAPNWRMWFPISTLAGLGAIFALRKKAIDGVPFAIVLVIFPIIYYVTHPWPTYRHPIEPIMVLMGVYAVQILAKGGIGLLATRLPVIVRYRCPE